MVAQEIQRFLDERCEEYLLLGNSKGKAVLISRGDESELLTAIFKIMFLENSEKTSETMLKFFSLIEASYRAAIESREGVTLH